MTRRAHLLGVCRYRDDVLSPLPVVRTDFEYLSAALRKRDFDVTTHGVSTEAFDNPIFALGRSTILRTIADALSSAEPGDDVLILLSGHGVHIDGQDFVVPADVHLKETGLTEFLVSVDFTRYIQTSRARNIAFIIDACREGIHLSTKGFQRWGRGAVAHAKGRRVVTVFSCGPGEFSRFTDGVEGFSLFSRAFADVLQGPTPPDFLDAIQRRLDVLAEEHQKKRQGIVCRDASSTGDKRLLDWITDPLGMPGYRHPAATGITSIEENGAKNRGTRIIIGTIVLIFGSVGVFAWSESKQDETRLENAWRALSCCLAGRLGSAAQIAWTSVRARLLEEPANESEAPCTDELITLRKTMEGAGKKSDALYDAATDLLGQIRSRTTNTKATFDKLYTTAAMFNSLGGQCPETVRPEPAILDGFPADSFRLARGMRSIQYEFDTVSLPDAAILLANMHEGEPSTFACLVGRTGAAQCRPVPEPVRQDSTWRLAASRAAGTFPLLITQYDAYHANGLIVQRPSTSLELEPPDRRWATVGPTGEAAVVRQAMARESSSGPSLFLVQELDTQSIVRPIPVPAGVAYSRQMHVGNKFVGWYLPAGDNLKVVVQPMQFLGNPLGTETVIATIPRSGGDETKVSWSECAAVDGSGAIALTEELAGTQHIAFFESIEQWKRGESAPVTYKAPSDNSGFIQCSPGVVRFTNLYTNGIGQVSCAKSSGCRDDFAPMSLQVGSSAIAIADKILIVSRPEDHGGWYYRLANIQSVATSKPRLLADDAVAGGEWFDPAWIQRIDVFATSGGFAGLILGTVQGSYLLRLFADGTLEPVPVQFGATGQVRPVQ